MAKGSHRLHALWVAVLVLLIAGVGAADASAHRGHGGTLRLAGLSKARALVGPNRCVEARRARRARAARVRARCGGRAAAAALPSGPAHPLYWGATIGSHLTGGQAPWDMGAVAKFEETSEKQVSAVQFFQPFAQCDPSCSFYPFPTTPLENIRQHGAIPVLSWSSQSIPSSLDEPDFQLSDVIEGRYDEFITAFATASKEWGHPFFLRFDWEMNGDWFPWAEGVNGNAPGQYVAAWRHVHDIFAAVGASNVTWVWCPFVDPGGSMGDLASLYPGDEYVDWTGLDGYNWGTNPASPRGWRSFDQLFSRTYGEIAGGLAAGKPMMLAEVGSSEQGGSKADWIREALSRVPTEYPRVGAFLWFDKFDDEMDWPVETSSAASAAFAEGVRQDAYRPAGYGELAASPIQPPA